MKKDGIVTYWEIKYEKEKYTVLQEDAIAQGVDNEDELEDIRARLANVRF